MKFALRRSGRHVNVFNSEEEALEGAKELVDQSVTNVEVWIAKDTYAEIGRPVTTSDLIECIWFNGKYLKDTPRAKKITFAAKLTTKGNSHAVAIPLEILAEMGLASGELVQITIEKIPRN